MPGLQTADPRKTAPLGPAERSPRSETEPRAPDKGMDGSAVSGPMESSKATHRPVQAKGAVGFGDAAVFLKEVAGGEKKPLGPAPKPKGLEAKGNTDGGMDSTDGSADDNTPPPPPPGEGGAGAAAPPPAPGGGDGPADMGSDSAKASGAVVKGKQGKTKGGETAAAKVGKKVFTAMPSTMVADFKTIGAQLTAAKKGDEAKGFAKMPTLKAVLPDDAQAAAKKKSENPAVDDNVTDGVAEADAPLPDGTPVKDQKGPKQKLASGDDAKLKELAGIMEHLKSFFGGILGGLSTDSKVKTDPGKAPPVLFQGQSNPVRAPRQEDDAKVKIDDGAAKAAKAIDDGPGPQDVHRQPMEELITPEKQPDVQVVEAVVDEGMAYYESISITPQERVKADKLLAPAVKGKMSKVDADLEKTLEAQERERDAAIEQSEKDTEAMNAEAQLEQEDMVAKAKKDIDAEQKKTKKKQKDEVKKAKKKGDKERRAVEKKVKKRQKDDDRKIKGEFKGAKKKAEGEKGKAEKKAKDEKKKAEEKKKKQSWWDRVKSAVSSIVNAVCKVIGGIFDVLGKLVSGIFNAVKKLATGLIDLACKFAKGLLDGLAKLMKGLISGLLGKVFPGLAKKLNGYIDKGLKAVKKGIDYVGDKLKKGVTAVCDTANAVVQKGLKVVKTGMQTAVRVAGCIATGDFKGAFLEVLYGAAEMAGISRATVQKILGKASDVLKKIVDEPVKFIKNLLKAGAGGFKKFVSGFIGFLKKAFIDWIVGPLAKGGLKVPKAFNVIGIFKMVGSLLGVTKDWIFGIVEKKLGPGAKAVLDKVMEYVDAFMKGGIAGVWEQIKSDVGNLWDMMMTFVIDFVKGKVITMAAEKLASLLAGPIGALYQVLKTAYNIYTTIRDKLDKIKAVLSGIFGSIGDIAKGAIGGATGKIVSALVAALGVAIDLFAKIASIGGIPKKIRTWLTNVGKKVQKAIEKLVDKVISKVKGLFKGGKGRDAKGKDKDKKSSPKLPAPAKFKTKDGKSHKVWTENKAGKLNTRVASTPKDVDKQVADSKGLGKDSAADVKSAIEAAAGKVSAANKKIDGKPTEKADAKKIEPQQRQLAKQMKQLMDADDAAGGASNLFDHLKAKGDATDSIDSGLKGALKKAKAPADPKKKMPALMTELLAARPTLKTLFVLNSNVGKSLTASLVKVEAEVPVNGAKQKRGFGDKSPWLAPLKKAVGEELAGPVRTPTITAQVLKKPKPVLTAAGKTKIVAWLKKQKGKDEGGDVPRTYAAYKKAVKKLRGGDFKELEGLAAKLKKEGGEGKRLHQKLDIDFKDLEAKKKEYLALRDKMDKESKELKAALKAEVGATEAADKAGGNGKTMPELLEMAKKLVREIRKGGGDDKALKTKLDGVMQASIQLGGQIDPDGMSKGRKLYEDIDGKTHKVLLKKAEAAGFSKRDQAKLSSDWRNWLREFFRKDIMGDQKAAEILFLRDQGLRGSRKGMPFEMVIKKAINNLKNPKEDSKKAALKGDFTMDTATEAELDKIYAEAIRMSHQTNKGATAGATKGDPKKLPQKKYKQKDDGESHRLYIEAKGGKPKVMRNPQPAKRVLEIFKGGKTTDIAKQVEKLSGQYVKKELPKTKQDELLKEIRAHMDALLLAMERARGDVGEDGVTRDQLVKDRKAFEQHLGHKISMNSKAKKSAKDMSEKAWAMMAVTWGDVLTASRSVDSVFDHPAVDKNPAVKAKIEEKLGMKLDSGFFGAVGPDYEKIKKAMKSGSMRVMVQHTINWVNAWKADADLMKKTPQQLKEFAQKANTLLGKAGKGAIDGDALEKKQEKLHAGKGDKHGLVSETENTHFAGLKKKEMDDKIASIAFDGLTDDELRLYAKREGLDPSKSNAELVAELTAKQDAKKKKLEESEDPEKKKKAKFITPGTTGRGDSNPKVSSSGSRADLQDASDKAARKGSKGTSGLSDAEQGGVGVTSDRLPFNEGMLANLLKEEDKWLKAARGMKMPLKAGISGNTRRWMQAAKLLGSDLPGARLAMLGHLIPTKAHSFHEIMTAAKGFVPYKSTAGRYLPLKPLADNTIRNWARDVHPRYKDSATLSKLLGTKK